MVNISINFLTKSEKCVIFIIFRPSALVFKLNYSLSFKPYILLFILIHFK
jgi:hypothetical protein